jgi:hypothetical protein
MKQLLATYAIQLVGYLMITHGMVSFLGKSWTQKTWSCIDVIVFSFKSLAGLVALLFSLDAVANASRGLSVIEGVAINPIFKLWVIALMPLFMTLVFGIELAKRTIEFGRLQQ